MTVKALHHVLLAMPSGREEEARRFYSGVLGFLEVPKPEHLARRGGVWFSSGSAELHLGVDKDFRPAKKAHPALLVDDLATVIAKCVDAGYIVNRDEPLTGFDRAYVADPFGNRIEMLQPDNKRLVRPEVASDKGAIAETNDRAFGGTAESEIVEAIRASGRPIISLVATIGSAVVGHIFFSPVAIESAGTPLMSFGLGPMAVLPEFQRQGIGSELVEAGLKECARQGCEVVVVLGHVDFYPRFGFQPARLFRLTSEYAGAGDAFMALELVKNALSGRSGIVRYLPEFGNA